MENKHFKMIVEEFTCLGCDSLVKLLGYTARDYCSKCLCSLHLDNYPCGSGRKYKQCCGK